VRALIFTKPFQIAASVGPPHFPLSRCDVDAGAFGGASFSPETSITKKPCAYTVRAGTLTTTF
jgi:hypothetical protein